MKRLVLQRLALIQSTYGLNDSAFANKIGISQTTFSNIINRDSDIKHSVLEKIVNSFGDISPEWLLTGNGDMFKTEISKIHKPKSAEKIYEEQTINLYNVDAAANLKTLFDQKNQNIIGRVVVPDMPKCDGAVNVKGDSMYPLLKSGDIVAYKEVNVDMRNIFFGEMYLVSIDLDGEEYLSVKYVQKSDLGDDWIKLVSHNTNHQPKDFPVSSIKAMGLIKFTIRFNTMK
ncbi:S24 family peptidase [uncultured Bacteroides sp.]|uniref:S24 family peptidase n=1 Tax=uncultured Bacteroides sp. TaxID=162156 RepID=UPI0026321085|nr:S24 family peptidase [uncultured Bacteroides sp.]